MAVEDWSTTAANNTTLGSIALGENAMSVNDINNTHREMMKQIADWRDGAIAALGGSYQPLDATLTALAAVTTAANKLIYATGSDTFGTTDITAYGRTLVGYASAAALKTALGTVSVTASSIANPGYVSLDLDGDGTADFTIQWGFGTIGSNSSGTITFPIPFTSFAICIPSGGSTNTGLEGDVHRTGSTGLTTQAISYSGTGNVTYGWVAVGK